MPFCTGQGTSDVGGCCHLGNGEVCPHYKTGDEARAWVETQGFKGQNLTRARNMAQGVNHACDIAIQVVAASATTLTNRSLFETNWRNHPGYVADVRPSWVEHEQRMGFPPESYNCPTWNGRYTARTEGYVPPDSPLACCFAQDEVTCEAQATNLHATAVVIRRGGGFTVGEP